MIRFHQSDCMHLALSWPVCLSVAVAVALFMCITIMQNLQPRVHLTESDFAVITDNGRLCTGRPNHLGPDEFERVMRRQLQRWVQVGGGVFGQQTIILKKIERDGERKNKWVVGVGKYNIRSSALYLAGSMIRTWV
jgi:hypothetical protein